MSAAQALRLFHPAESSPDCSLNSIAGSSPTDSFDPVQLQTLIDQLTQLLPTRQHRLAEPVLKPANPPSLFAAELEAEGVGTESQPTDAWAAWNSAAIAAERYQPKLVPADLRANYAATTSLPRFYRDCVSGRWEVVRKDVKPATHQKDRQALNRWQWGTRPATWPKGLTWEGPSLAVIEAANEVLVDEFIQRMEVASPEDPEKPLSPSTIATTWTPLRTILKHAVAMRAISRFPEPSGLPDKEVEARPYTDEEIERLWPFLNGQPLLRCALVISVNCGLRPIDLFTLKREALVQDTEGRWTLKFKARKTSKKHWIPLAEVTVRALRAAEQIGDRSTLPGISGEYFFPGLSDPKIEEPEDSHAARTRAKLTRVIWDAAGLQSVERPWQSGRAMCATRLSTRNRDAGKFVLGTNSGDVFATHYAPARPDFWDAILSVPQPACFLKEFCS